MAEFPGLTIWTDALIGDTTHLSAAEFGAYMLTLIVAWRMPDCKLPNDDAYLARITRTGRNWSRVKPAVMALWKIGDDGKWYQKRLLREYESVSRRHTAFVSRGQASALKRKQSRSVAVPVDVEPPSPSLRVDSESRSTIQSESKTTSQPVPVRVNGKSSSENWDGSKFTEAFLHGANFCTHQATVSRVQLDPWIRAGLEPADLIRAFDRGMAWAAAQPEMGPRFRPRDLKFFGKFLEGELIEKRAAGKLRQPEKSPEQKAADAQALAERVFENCLLRLNVIERGGPWDFGDIELRHWRAALDRKMISLEFAWEHNMHKQPGFPDVVAYDQQRDTMLRARWAAKQAKEKSRATATAH